MAALPAFRTAQNELLQVAHTHAARAHAHARTRDL
jgi:hypothetical protein